MTNSNQTKKQHVHAEVIKAWADGESIQYISHNGKEWFDWKCSDGAPGFYESHKYRVKPQPKPDFEISGHVSKFKEGYENFEPNNMIEFLGFRNMVGELDNLKLTFDGETGKLKSAEVI